MRLELGKEGASTVPHFARLVGKHVAVVWVHAAVQPAQAADGVGEGGLERARERAVGGGAREEVDCRLENARVPQPLPAGGRARPDGRPAGGGNRPEGGEARAEGGVGAEDVLCAPVVRRDVRAA